MNFRGGDLNPDDYLHTTPSRMRWAMGGASFLLLIAVLGLIAGAPLFAEQAGDHWGETGVRLRWLAGAVGVFAISISLLFIAIPLVNRLCKIALHRDLLRGLPKVNPESNDTTKGKTK